MEVELDDLPSSQLAVPIYRPLLFLGVIMIGPILTSIIAQFLPSWPFGGLSRRMTSPNAGDTGCSVSGRNYNILTSIIAKLLTSRPFRELGPWGTITCFV